MNILKISFQYSTYTGKGAPFRSEIDKTTSSKQIRSFYVRKEIKMRIMYLMGSLELRSFRPQSVRPNQESLRSIQELLRSM